MGFILKDWYGKEQVFNQDKIFVRDENGELVQFTKGAGASPDVRYVTFMSYDGLVEYGKKAVAVGDDCADPIARGVFATPTRESDVQYNYTFYGWATTANGAADSKWNKAIMEDKTVYANFASSVRYYTITYYDNDGTTVLKTESLAYGTTPSYVPKKTDYTFTGWTPEITAVIGNASYTASWVDAVDFGSLTWAEIDAYSKSGKAAEKFEIGATKTFVTLSGKRTVVAKIIGFNHDDLSDGSGKAGITLEFNYPASNQSLGVNTVSWGGNVNNTTQYQKSWDDCNFRSYWNKTSGSGFMLTSDLPQDLVSVIKKVKKKYFDIPNGTIETTDDYLWPMSMSEMGFVSSGIYNIQDEGDCYAGYTPGKKWTETHSELIKYADSTAVDYFTRSKWASGLNTKAIGDDGKPYNANQGAEISAFPCFCI